MGDLFGGGADNRPYMEPPAPKPPAPMPDPDSAAVKEARKRSQADILGRAGRSSTILTAPENRKASPAVPALGFDSYNGSTLGQGG